ncbi:hypothetical protein EI42_05736 [Thermosporothrix hazakensis]|jgi:hypothetical protein|uniref:Uncharacterized protein n=1 Tax=Thermosporothrix hazakensis TaxID=644383 RepID=A0A326TVS5_THEHA|nr:hypothetical protein [Thermosporothrix hazakensis]PZW20975.1 hypothetical protein EI42_05736 [Thermosporothrix hazakensis]GCE49257.1 hypothetical protein KTH_41260 [Thermosporothrix hazakensis]
MDAEQFIEYLETLSDDEVRDNFPDLLQTALAIEASEQQQPAEEQNNDC